MAVTVRALFFDVFGTLVDWRTSIAREVEAILKPLGCALDWSAFADRWRGEYQDALEEVRSGRAPYCKLDVLHRRNLEVTLKRFNIDSLNEEQKHELNLAWHRLDA
jgi:2-haloacid dehalogenase